MTATSAVSGLLYFLIFTSCLLFLWLYYARRSWVAFTLVAGLALRLLVAMSMDSGLKYYFVIDSMRYERNAWWLAQKWMTQDFYSTAFASEGARSYNLYEDFLATIFRTVGFDPLLATFINAFLSFLTVFLIYRIQLEYIGEKFPAEKFKNPQLFTAIVLGLYPSFIIWSATNVRDPLYFLGCVGFFYFFLCVFSGKSTAKVPFKIMSVVLCVASFKLVESLRAYVNTLFIAAIIAGLIIYAATKYIRIRPVLLCATLFAVVFAYSYQILIPESANSLLANIGEMRLSFANLRLADSVARSSFALDHTFTSMTDIFTFLPISISHYFFGPFPWEIASLVQVFSLLECLAVYALTYPTWVGIKLAYRRVPFETIVLLTFVCAFALVQGLVISNMGTIFRHRTLGFLFLAIFTGEGIYAIGKKNYPTFFTT